MLQTMQHAQEEHDSKTAEKLRSVYAFRHLDHTVLRPQWDLDSLNPCFSLWCIQTVPELRSESVFSCREQKYLSSCMVEAKICQIWIVRSWYSWEKVETILICLPVPSVYSSNPVQCWCCLWQVWAYSCTLMVWKGEKFLLCVCNLCAICCDPSVYFEKYSCHDRYSIRMTCLAFKCLGTTVMVTVTNFYVRPAARTTFRWVQAMLRLQSVNQIPLQLTADKLSSFLRTWKCIQDSKQHHGNTLVDMLSFSSIT